MTENFRPTVLRNKAWNGLSGKWGMAALAYLIFMLISGGVSSVFAIVPIAPLVVVIFVTNLINIGSVFLYKDVSDGKEVEIGTLFAPFKENYMRYVVGGLLVLIYTFLWSLLLIIPGIIKGISYAMTYYIMRDNPTMTGEQCIQRSMEMMRRHIKTWRSSTWCP